MARKDPSIARLIRQRMQDLGITRGKLVRRMGYANIAKGCRRIDQICGGRFEFSENLRVELAEGLEVEVNVIDESIEVTRAELNEAEDQAYRATFKPHAGILTEQNVPSQITFYAMTGGSRHRIIQFKEWVKSGNVRDAGTRGASERGAVPGRSNRICYQLHS